MPPASRITDMHVCPMVTGIVPHVGGPILPPGAPTVLIGFLPAATVTCMATCVGPPDVIVKGSAGVMINFMPAARIGDLTAHGGVIVLGFPTVIIGEVGAPSPGAGGAGMINAGLSASNMSQFSPNVSAYGKGGSFDPAAPSSAGSSPLANSSFNGVKADRVLPGSSDNVAVIGRSMDNAVMPYSQGLADSGQDDVDTFSGDQISPGALTEWNSLKKQYSPDMIPPDVVKKSQLFKENKAWAQKLKDQGYTVVDVDNPGNQPPSPFYDMEKQVLFGDDDSAGGS